MAMFKLVHGQKMPCDKDDAIEFCICEDVEFANLMSYDPETKKHYMIMESKKLGKVWLIRRDG